MFGGATQPREELSAGERERLRRALDDCLRARGGEVSAWERAAELATTYLGLGDVGRRAFLSLIASEFGTPLEPATTYKASVVFGNGQARRTWHFTTATAKG